MACVHNYISCPSLLIRLTNACERWSGVTITDSQICFWLSALSSLCCKWSLSVFSRAGCVFPGWSRPNTKPGNKGSISKLIRLQTCFGRRNHFIMSFTIGHQKLFQVAIFHSQFPAPRLYSPTCVNKSPLISIFIELRVGGQECWPQIMKTMFLCGFKSLCGVNTSHWCSFFYSLMHAQAL